MENSTDYFSRRLLIISCTRRKDPTQVPISAWERYKGGCFPTLKSIQASIGIPSDIDIFIISAKYGVLTPHDLIDWYDQKMTFPQAIRLQPVIEQKFGLYLQNIVYRQTLVFLEKIYLMSMEKVVLPHPIYFLDEFTENNFDLLRSWIFGKL